MQDRLELRVNPPNVAVPSGRRHFYVDADGNLIKKSPEGVKEVVGGGAAILTRTVAEGPPRPYRLQTAFAGENNDFVLESSGRFTSLVIVAAASSNPTTNSANLSGTVYTVTVGSPGGGVAGTMTASELVALLILPAPAEFVGLALGNNGSGNVVPGTYPLVPQSAAAFGQKCVVGGSVPLEFSALNRNDLTQWTLNGPGLIVRNPSGVYFELFINDSNAVDFKTYTPAD